jgi:hypothetical protein
MRSHNEQPLPQSSQPFRVRYAAQPRAGSNSIANNQRRVVGVIVIVFAQSRRGPAKHHRRERAGNFRAIGKVPFGRQRR